MMNKIIFKFNPNPLSLTEEKARLGSDITKHIFEYIETPLARRALNKMIDQLQTFEKNNSKVLTQKNIEKYNLGA